MLKSQNKKGFILVYFLSCFCFVSAVYLFYMETLQVRMHWLKIQSNLKERLVLERIIIERVVEEFTSYEEKDFEMEINHSFIRVSYNDLVAHINVEGKFNFIAELHFDDFCECIITYNYLNE